MVAFVQADTHPNTTLTTLDDQHRRMEGRDGIREDYTGGAFAVTLSTTAPTLTVASAGRSILVDGNLLDFTGEALDAVLDPRDTGVMPTGTQVRTDLVVARYDTDVEVIANRGRLVVKAGTPGGSASSPPAAPGLTRTPGGTWEVPISSHVLPAAGLLTTRRDLRWWSGDHALVSGTDPAALHGPVGCTRDLGGSLWRRRLGTSGPVWAQETALHETVGSRPISDDPLGFVRDGAAASGLVTALAVPARPYTREADVRAGFLTTDFGSASAYADVWVQLWRAGVLVSDGGGAGRVRAAAGLKGCSSTLGRSFGGLDAGVAYEFRLVASTPAGAVRFSRDPRYTYAEVTTRAAT